MQFMSTLSAAALYAASSTSSTNSLTANSSSSETSPANSSTSKSQVSLSAAPTSLLSSSTLMNLLSDASGGSSAAVHVAENEYSSNVASDGQFMDVSGITGSTGKEISPGLYSTTGYAVAASQVASVESSLGVVAVWGTDAGGAATQSSGYTVYTLDGQPASEGLSQQFTTAIDKIGYDSAHSGQSTTSESGQANLLATTLSSAANSVTSTSVLAKQQSLAEQLIQTTSS